MVAELKSDLFGALRELGSERGNVYEPNRFVASDPQAMAALEDLVESGRVVFFSDTVETQLAELMEIRAPHRDLSEQDKAAMVRAHLDGQEAHAYGVWVYYPWARRLVHVLAEAEFKELVQSRNRNKITEREQAQLERARIGIVGLSVGQATALTLAMEGVGGELRLADFDALSLSNMNRLRAGVHEIGLNKCVLAARAVFEMNPYARLRLFRHGITEDNMESFLCEPEPLDVLVEECDDLYMKIRVREHARARGIPVVMETSDRGLLDIERYDLEPTRPILHGLVGDVCASRLKGLSTYDKVPIVLRMLGQQSVSPRLAASMVEIRSTLKSWPQLASAVALGGATSTDAVRRLLLGQLETSGRFYVDLESVVQPGREASLDVASDQVIPLEESQRSLAGPSIRDASGRVDMDAVRTLVSYGTMAPSGGNCQPWRFQFDGVRLRCIHDVSRSQSYLDFGHRATHMAFGAAIENIELTASAMGLGTRLNLFPDPNDLTALVDVHFCRGAAPEAERTLFVCIPHRVTNRRLAERQPLDPSARLILNEAVTRRGARLQLIEDPERLAEIGEILGRGDRLRFLNRVMHGEMMHEIRWTREEARQTRDGLDLATLELTATDLAGMRMTSSWPVMQMVGKVGGGQALQKPSRKAVACASAVGLITMPDTSSASFFAGGRALQRMWLTAHALGYGMQPMTALTYLFLRMHRGGDCGDLRTLQCQELKHLWQRYRQLFDVGESEGQIMLFRLARLPPPTARSLRRHVDDILMVQ